MVDVKSQDPYIRIIASLLCDVQTLHDGVITPRAARLTTEKVISRTTREGLGFLTKTLPRLGKALDRALTGEVCIDAAALGFKSQPCSKLPKLFGELFNTVLSPDGWILPNPSVQSIKSLRDILFVFYKLELPYSTDQEQQVIDKFVKTEQSLAGWNSQLGLVADLIDADADPYLVAGNPRIIEEKFASIINQRGSDIVRTARRLLSDVFSTFDIKAISPRHGPGAVSTKETTSGKYVFKEVSPRILATYPLDEYFYASMGHVCDELVCDFPNKLCENSAKVILVPKDSRGPRLISCEPLDFQWVQQGLGRAIVQHVEQHPLTRYSIHFTDQTPNRCGASLGSATGGYSTLDLNEASDRVSIGLVRLLFPEPLLGALLNCRSLSTVLPGGEKLKLNKFAPMGSALCFPVMALTIWALLAAGLPDARSRSRNWKQDKLLASDCRDGILVYGDDVIVPTAQAANAMNILESFGLKINRDKSCYTGFFRESCGKDAYRGVDVTPVRIRTTWTHLPSPDSYVSYIAYANAFHGRKYYKTHETIVAYLCRTYGEIPDVDMNLSCPSLIGVPEEHRPRKVRTNKRFQTREFYVTDLKSPVVREEIGGWNMLLRFFAENVDRPPLLPQDARNVRLADAGVSDNLDAFVGVQAPFSVRMYTKRKTSYLVKRWR